MSIEVCVRGKRTQLDAAEGWTLLEILRAHELPIPHVCEGQGACGTCHVVIAREWADRLPPPREDEAKLLAEVPGVEPGSRLACQLIYEEELEGLSIKLPMPFEAETSAA